MGMNVPAGGCWATAVPRWQLVALLAGFPTLYVLNSLAPWSAGLFVKRDHAYFWPFWASVALIHWASLAAALLVLRRAGGRLADIGLTPSPRAVALMLVVPALAGAVVILFRQTWPAEEAAAASTSLRKIMYPGPVVAEQAMWVFLSISAGVCEEVVYRGLGITALQRRGVPTWLAVVLTTTAFVFVHGIAGAFLFPAYFAAGLLFAGLYLWLRDLPLLVCVHAVIDLGAILAGA